MWVILAYMISSTVLVLFAGRLSDLFGRKQAYVARVRACSASRRSGAGFSGGGTELILWRIAQGIGGAFLFANAGAIVTDAFPKEQLGLAMGTNTMVAAVGLVIGPVLGGALVAISWHWVFWFNVPFALVGSLWALLDPARAGASRTACAASTSRACCTFVAGLTGLRLRALARGAERLGRSADDRRDRRRRRCCCRCSCSSSATTARRCSTSRSSTTGCSAAATAAAFINGLSRFALLFLFVFYFQGVKGDDPIKAGIELAPMAIGMLIASPLAGMWADRHGSRALAAWGMVVGAVALAGMTTLGVDTPYFWSALWLFVVGVGSGMFNSPNTAAMMGTVPADRRGIAAGARTMLQNTGAVISIAFVLAVVTSSVDKDTLFKIFSGVTTGLSTTRRWTRSSPTCTRRCGCWRRRRWSARACR